MNDEQEYDALIARLHTNHPTMFSRRYGGISVGKGWWTLIESLCRNIDEHVNWKTKQRSSLQESNPYNHPIPEEVEPVTVAQIKEKFGGLRFYYDGGDDKVDGMVQMAESWAAHTCEECGKPGKFRTGGWLRTLCDEHEELHQQRRNMK